MKIKISKINKIPEEKYLGKKKLMTLKKRQLLLS